MLKKTQNGIYIDKGPGHCGQFSGDFHKSGKYRYMAEKKRWNKKSVVIPFIQNVKVRINLRKYPILSNFFNKKD